MYEFNEAAKGYWRKYEREVWWLSREIVWELIRGNPYYKPEDKPKRKTDIMKLNMDKVEKIKPQKVTAQDIKVMEHLAYNIK